MSNHMARVLFTAPKSGSGKTMVVCGMIEALKRKNKIPACIKCGPDYIDPMFHRKVLGIDSGNLDSFFTEGETIRYLLVRKMENADITLMEGVMGYYDGLGGQSEKASTYEIAQITKTPVILVVDGHGASVSLAAVIQGMIKYRKDSNIQGVLLNRVSAGYYGRLKELIEKECQVKVVGYLPDMKDLYVPSRHLGLITPEEMKEFHRWAEQIAIQMEESVDLEAIMEIAAQAQKCEGKRPQLPKIHGKVKLAVAMDEAFSFYYKENLELLCEMGAQIVTFSPLHDESLPDDIDGILFGGGYPENYVKELEKNKKMRMQIQRLLKDKMPCLAECGGFLYLQKSLEGSHGSYGEMTGVFDGEGFKTSKLKRFGYVQLEIKTPGILGECGQIIRGHEFHYWDCTKNGEDFVAKKPTGKISYDCMIHTPFVAAGFPHLYYYSHPEMIHSFLQACKRFQAQRLARKHWDAIAKPIDSLGQLEKLVIQLCKISGDSKPWNLQKRALLILCADHRVVDEGVTQTGSEVTKIVAENFAKGCSTVNYMAESANVDIYTIDVGMDTAAYPEKNLVQHAVIDRKIARGTRNIAIEAAMTRKQYERAIETGRELVKELKENGYQVLSIGEMGIGNTTPSSALTSLFLSEPIEKVTGRGAGLSDQSLERKRIVVKKIVDRVKKNKNNTPEEILIEAGGYEIVAMTGIFLEAKRQRIPVILDGAISAAAALAAAKIDPGTVEIMIASHVSKEGLAPLILKELGLRAIIHADMSLGEGSGAITLFPLLDMAMNVYKNMGTFEEYNIEEYKRFHS